jgi:hypothetical protein
MTTMDRPARNFIAQPTPFEHVCQLSHLGVK